MAQEIREAILEALDAEDPGPNLNAVHPTSSFAPLEPLRLTPPRITTNAENTTPNARSLRWRPPIAMAAICAGGLVTAFDSVIVATALPSIASDLSATTAESAWVGASYLLGSTALQPVWPNFSKFVGRR